MSNAVFPFVMHGRFSRASSHRTVSVAGEGGVTVTRNDGGVYGQYRATFSLRFPQGSYTITDFEDFLNSIAGAYDTFLFKDPFSESVVSSESAGTGNATSTDFPLDCRHVDSTTLRVFKDGVEVTSGWSLVDNNTSPKVRFSVAPSIGVVVTVSYEFYYPCRFVEDPEVGEWVASTHFLCGPYTIEEDYDGAHRA